MNSKTAAQTIQQTREWARAEYEQATKGLNFTKDFQSRQEALMRDPLATVGERVMAWILRRSWGEFRLYAIKEDGEPAYQRDCSRELGLGKTVVSKAVAYLQQRGYLENQPKRLYPVISPVLGGPPQKDKKLPAYATFYENWKVAHASNFEAYKVANATIKDYWKVVHADYRKSRKQQQTAPVSLFIESKKIKEESPSSSSAVVSLPPRVEKAEEEEPYPYQKFKATYPAAHFDEPKAKPSFEKKSKAKQALILERLEIYLTCERWMDEGGRWIPFASKWLESYESDPPPAMKKSIAPAKKDYVESLREEAERRIAKYGRI